MRLSIITINYNNLIGLKASTESVWAQSFKNFEYIIIDGGSTDGSAEYLESNKAKFTYCLSEQDSGIYDAMNKGIREANGEYLLFINSGDTLFDSNTLKQILPHLKNYDIIYGNMKIDVNGKFQNGFMPENIDLIHMIQDTLWHPVSFIKKELFDKFGLYSNQYKICGDYDFFFKTIIKEKVSTKHIDNFISVFVLDGLSSNPMNKALIAKERLAIQNTYLSPDKIQEYSKLKPNKSFMNRLIALFR